MLFTGIIKYIASDFKTCWVEIPALSTGGNDYVQKDVHFSTPPGVCGIYKVEDVVFITFEENDAAKAIVIGKDFLDINAESTTTVSLGNLYANSLDVKKLSINGLPFEFSSALSTIFTGLLSKNDASAENENYENLVNKFVNVKVDAKSQTGVKIYPEAQIGTFGIKAINSKEPKLMRQEFVLDALGDNPVINFTDKMKTAAIVKININDTFIVADKTVLTPGIYESSAKKFEVIPDLTNKQIKITTSGFTNIEQIYITTEYWN